MLQHILENTIELNILPETGISFIFQKREIRVLLEFYHFQSLHVFPLYVKSI